MTIYDQHMHTLYSFDSEAQLRDYLAQTQAPVVTTEHLEFDNPDDGGRDDLPDYAGMKRTQAALASHYQNEMLLGIEQATLRRQRNDYAIIWPTTTLI